MSGPKTVGQLLEVGTSVLEDSSRIFEDHDNEMEARELLAFCMRTEPNKLKRVEEPSRFVRDRYLALVTRRAAGEPLPFLVGRIEFYGLELKVKPGVFVPRPSSELMVARAVKRLRRRRDPVAIDVCTGQGPIALAMADVVPSAEVWGTDISEEAVAVGRSNAKRLGVRNVRFRSGNMFDSLPSKLHGGVDVITAHVPYVPPDELEDLPSEVKDHEPSFTLTDESHDGLGLMRRAVAEAPQWLKPGGWLLLEMSEDIAPKARRMLRRAGLEDRGVAVDADRLSVVLEGRLNQ